MQKFKDSYYGFLIGDAAGIPIKYEDRRKLLENPVTEMIGYGSYAVPAGSWSDESSMMLATMDSICHSNGIDFNDMMTKYSEWISFAKYTSVGEVFDIGRTTLKAIIRFQEEGQPLGLASENDNGNGSVVRMLPIAFYANVKKLGEDDIIDLVCQSSSLTHGHEISKLGCYIYVRYMMFLLAGCDKKKSYELIKKLDYSFFSMKSRKAYKRILEDDITKYSIEQISSSGYIVNTLETVIWCIFNTNNFRHAILGTINLGGDTDTIGALTGALAGIIYGFNSIPEEWLEVLQKREYLKLMYTSFIKTLNNLK